MLYVNSNQNATFTSKLNVKPEAVKRNFFRGISEPMRENGQELKKDFERRVFGVAGPLKVKLQGVEEIIKKKAESKSTFLFQYMQRKGKYLLSKIQEDWKKAIGPKFISEPENCENDVILRFLFGR